MQRASEHTALYLYFDEAGDFNFKANGSKSFFMTCVATHRPFDAAIELMSLHYELLEQGQATGYFHASEDRQMVRDRVFEVIARHENDFTAFVYQAKKGLMEDVLSPKELYADAFESIVHRIAQSGLLDGASLVVVVTDAIPMAARKGDYRSPLKAALKKHVSKRVPFRLIHQRSEGDYNLQIADYLCWSAFRCFERGDSRFYGLVSSVWSGLDVSVEVVRL